MLVIDPLLGSVTIAAVAMMVPAIALWRRFAQDTLRKVREAIAELNSGLQENIAGIRVVQSLNRQQINIGRFRKVNRDYLDAILRANRHVYGLSPSVEMLAALEFALVVVLGGQMVISGSLQVGGLVALLLYVGRPFGPIGNLTQ
jgi:ATP-binding cassette subfamily B protein